MQQPGRWFASYWAWQLKYEHKRLRRWRQEIGMAATGRVLEVGCGTGANFRHYTPAATRIVAIDPSPYMLARARAEARRRRRPIELVRASAEALPFRDGVFDTAVSTANMCTIPDPARALREIRRTLPTGGTYRFYDHVLYDHAFGRFCQRLADPMSTWLGAGCHVNRDVEALVRAAGFREVRTTFAKVLPPVPPLVFLRPHVLGVAEA
jgi:ubiquinone/menaquinone biosynthesis C-methylase UbiE